MKDKIKQVLIAIIIILIIVSISLIIKFFLFDNKDKSKTDDNEIKEKYEYNEYKILNISAEKLAIRYLLDFNYKMLYNIEEAYKCLSSETKENMFASEEVFKKYIKANQEEISVSYLKQYNVISSKDIFKVDIIDQHHVRYLFESNAVMNYTVTFVQ